MIVKENQHLGCCPNCVISMLKKVLFAFLILSNFILFTDPDILSSSMIEKGLERLFEIIEEIEKDAPAARSIVAAYIARGVVDEIIPPSYLVDPVACDLGGDMIERAKLLLSRDHGGAKLEKIWGPGGN